MTGDLENVSEMVAEKLEASKDQQRESATSGNNVHVQNLQFDLCRKSNFSA